MPRSKQILPLLIVVLFLAAPASPQIPVINAGGVVNAADYTQSFSPGIIVSIFGQNLAPATELAQTVPLPTTLAGVSVAVARGGATVEAPLFFVSAGQINAQLPYGFAAGPAQVRVRNGSGESNIQTIDVDAARPRLFTQTMDGRGEAILLHTDYSLVTKENPARAGEWVVLYLTGLGEVQPAVVAGQPGGDGGSSGELNHVAGIVSLSVDGAPANVNFAGLAPYYVGLYQVNFQVPENAAPGMVRISVQLGESSSQESVTFGCAVAYEQLTSAHVGPGGGTVSSGGFSAEIPAGALSSDTQIAVHRVTGGTAVSSDSADPIFGLEGIPDDYIGPLTITLQIPGDAPVAGEGRLVLIEEGGVGGEVVADTEVDGSTVTATLQIGGGGGTQTSSLRGSARAAGSFDSATRGVQLWQYVRKLGHQTSPSGHFDAWYNKKGIGAGDAGDVGQVLDWAEQQLLGMGYRWKASVRFPISVTLTPSEWAFGVVKRSTRDGTLTMRIMVPRIQPSIGERRVAWGSVLLRLFHLQYDLQTRFDGLGDVTAWTWWHRAVAQHFAERFSPVSGAGFPSAYNSDFLFKNPLQLPATTGGASSGAVGDHAIGAANFVEHLDSRKGAGWIQSVLENWAPDNAPIDASIAADIDVSEEWLEFCRRFSEGGFEARVPQQTTTAEVMTKRSLANNRRLGDEQSLPMTVTWGAGRDLMAEVYRFAVAHGWPARSSLFVSLPSGGSDIAVRVFEDDDPNGSPSPRFLGELTGSETLEIPDFDKYQGTSLVLMLINKRAVRPYNGITPAQVRLEVKDGEESEVLGWLRQCKKIIVQLWGVKSTCSESNGGSVSCGFDSMTIRSWLNSTDSLLDIHWDGRTFSWEGAIDTPWESPARVEHYGSGTVSADGLSFEGGTFRDTAISANGFKIVRELEIRGPLPWVGFKQPREQDKSYNYRVDGPQEVPRYIVKITYRSYNGDGSLYHEMTKIEYTSPNANLYVAFQKE